MLNTYLMFIVGFVLLIKSADYLVEGASSIARKIGISNLIIGLTIVAFGTSAPELIVNILASLHGSNELAISNILGSNISNVFLILGIAAIIYPLNIHRGTTWKEIPLTFLGVLAVGAMLNDALFDKTGVSVLSRIDGFVLLLFFSIFIYYTFLVSQNDKEHLFGGPKGEKIKTLPSRTALLMVVGGSIGLTLGGKWIVEGASVLARNWGMSEAMIGATIVAIGTSLPELATSAMAAYRKNADIAIGNIVGSNIFNIFWILGVSSLIRPISFNPMLNGDLLVVLGSTILLFFFIFVGKKNVLGRGEGITFTCCYLAYLIFAGWRG